MANESSPKTLTAVLRDLPQHDMDSWRREQIRRRALAEFRRSAALAQRPWLATSVKAYNRVFEPLFAATVSVVYLSWAAGTIADIMAGR